MTDSKNSNFGKMWGKIKPSSQIKVAPKLKQTNTQPLQNTLTEQHMRRVNSGGTGTATHFESTMPRMSSILHRMANKLHLRRMKLHHTKALVRGYRRSERAPILSIIYEHLPTLEWAAYFDPEGLVGYGKTQQEAADNLIEQIEDSEE